MTAANPSPQNIDKTSNLKRNAKQICRVFNGRKRNLSFQYSKQYLKTVHCLRQPKEMQDKSNYARYFSHSPFTSLIFIFIPFCRQIFSQAKQPLFYNETTRCHRNKALIFKTRLSVAIETYHQGEHSIREVLIDEEGVEKIQLDYIRV